MQQHLVHTMWCRPSEQFNHPPMMVRRKREEPNTTALVIALRYPIPRREKQMQCPNCCPITSKWGWTSEKSFCCPNQNKNWESRNNRGSGAHYEVNKTLSEVRERFYSGHYREDVEDSCKKCTTCAVAKRPKINYGRPWCSNNLKLRVIHEVVRLSKLGWVLQKCDEFKEHGGEVNLSPRKNVLFFS